MAPANGEAQGTRARRISSDAQPRSKRAKYTSIACNECKKRKLRCHRAAGSHDCERCIAADTECTYIHPPPDQTSVTPVKAARLVASPRLDSQEEQVSFSSSNDAEHESNEISLLRQQVTQLSDSLKELSEKIQQNNFTFDQAASTPSYTNSASSRVRKPKEPLFVGHTRSAFSLDVAKSSLTKMGITADNSVPTSAPSSTASTPREGTPERSELTAAQPPVDPLLSVSRGDIMRLTAVFQDEIESVYPFIDSEQLAHQVAATIEDLRSYLDSSQPGTASDRSRLWDKDLRLLKVVIASGLVIEARGRNDLSDNLVRTVEAHAVSVTRTAEVDLRDLQLLTLMSIYYFHCDEDLLAWRTIGSGARMALEMGLHRKRSVLDNYKSPELQAQALRIFWCVYALDRRWSFATGLSFALADRDIDPELPEPGDDYQYLRCLVGYGRLCSKVWEALPPFGSPTNTVPVDQVQYLEFLTHNWLNSIPADLQLRHPRLGLAPRNQPRPLRRLRALLYLRGNHMRTLIHRHHVFSSSLIYADLPNSRLVVDIAKDSIDVLVDLAETSDIYIRQQPAFNYFLLSALAVILLAVCNAPELFSEACHDRFSSSIALVRRFSRHSHASKRLWRTIRGLLPAVKSLGLRIPRDGRVGELGNPVTDTVNQAPPRVTFDTRLDQEDSTMNVPLGMTPDAAMLEPMGDLNGTVPDIYQMSNDLLGLFDAFGQGRAGALMGTMDPLGMDHSSLQQPGYPEEISRRFQDLI